MISVVYHSVLFSLSLLISGPPLVFYGIILTLYSSLFSSPVSDNRASLLRSSAPTKRVPTESQKDLYLRIWRNQVAMAMRLIPQILSVAIRCASPDLSLR